jgi:hypothetical protein
VTSTFTLIDAAHRGVILGKVQNYGRIRWHSQSKNKKQRLNQDQAKQSSKYPSLQLHPLLRYGLRVPGMNTAFVLGFYWQFFFESPFSTA